MSDPVSTDVPSPFGQSRWDATPFLEKVTAIAPTIIYVFNQQTQSNEYSNRSIGESLGYEVEEIQRMGEALMPTLCHPEDLPRVVEHLQQVASTDDGDVLQLTYRMKHKTGGWVWLLSYDTVFERDETGDVLSQIGVASDITAQMEAEYALKEANDKLVALNQELAELAYVASHDMRAPIANIAELARAVQERVPADDESSSLLGLILRSCERADERIEAVVAVAQARDSTLADEPVAVSMAAAIENACEAIGPLLQTNDVTLAVETSAADTVSFAPLQLQSILVNLLTNAIKYRHQDRTPTIEIRTEPGDGSVLLTVADNGVGIDIDRDRDRIFALFKQGSNHEVDGNGVGLYLVRQMMLRAGGDIEVASSPGDGATFTLTFPVVGS
ncbi:MAG: PAS domain-containing sensor histidine kinase [Actinomycetota bacterium]